jgi:predicted transcriptional regulator
MRYRSRIDIISQILEAANGGASKSKIMYKALLSYNQMKDYVELLIEKDMLVYDQQEVQTFRTTEKGLKFLYFYNEISEVIKESPPQQQQVWM